MDANNMQVYNQVRKVPDNAKKPIQGGRLRGKTDINPMWRIEKLTEIYGPCGVGWKYIIKEKRLEAGANGEVAAFVDIDLHVKNGDTWSEAIPGTGGNVFIANESKGLYTSDECFKMALTDAISVSCKALGFAADVYWDSDPSKYEKDDVSTHDIYAIKKRVEMMLTEKMLQKELPQSDIARMLGLNDKQFKNLMESYQRLYSFEKALAKL